MGAIPILASSLGVMVGGALVCLPAGDLP